jgi:nucleoside-diphosphate-sugar epimerase
MVVVAIFGGTGGVGRTLVDAFKADRKHQVIVFARKVNMFRIVGGHLTLTICRSQKQEAVSEHLP